MKAQLSRVFTLIVSTACWFFGQQAPPQAPPESSAAFHSESELVLTTFNVVRDKYFAPDVKPDDVVLLEDGKPRDFSTFEGPGTGRRPPLELVLLFGTSTLPPMDSKLRAILPTYWDRKAIYDFTNHWGDQESRAVLEKNGADVRVSVYRYDHRQMQRLCRSTKDPEALTNAIHRLPEPIPDDETIPLILPPSRMTFDDLVAKNRFPIRPNKDPFHWPLSWTMEAMIAALKDSVTTPSNAIRVLAVFSEGGPEVGATTTTAQDAADQANALGILVYPVVLDSEEYARHPLGIWVHSDGTRTTTPLPLWMVRFGEVGTLTGGQAFYPSRIDAGVVDQILERIRNLGLSRYVVGFAPAPSGRRREHELEVKLKSKAVGKLVGGKRTAVY